MRTYIIILISLFVYACASSRVDDISKSLSLREVYKNLEQIDTSQIYVYNYKKLSTLNVYNQDSIQIVSYRIDTILHGAATYKITQDGFAEVNISDSFEIETDDFGKQILKLQAISKEYLLYSKVINENDFGNYIEIQYLAVLISRNSNEKIIFSYKVGERQE